MRFISTIKAQNFSFANYHSSNFAREVTRFSKEICIIQLLH
eukprot:CCRYP_000249-RB/>CCRYP_000249-RB protein AED:0.35 eAED:1.00 QI:0/-1/0/1/-1/0/1/0/40